MFLETSSPVLPSESVWIVNSADVSCLRNWSEAAVSFFNNRLHIVKVLQFFTPAGPEASSSSGSERVHEVNKTFNRRWTSRPAELRDSVGVCEANQRDSRGKFASVGAFFLWKWAFDSQSDLGASFKSLFFVEFACFSSQSQCGFLVKAAVSCKFGEI